MQAITQFDREVEEDRLGDRSDDVTQPWTHGGESRRPAFEFDAGEIFGRYVITGRLGVGGMGAVYAARDPELGRMVSLKVSPAKSPKSAGRLLREAQCAAKVRHDHVVSIFEAGIERGRGFAALQHVAGFDLEHHLGRLAPAGPRGRRSSDLARPLRWFAQVGLALAAVHEAELVHRDFKPANVLIDPQGKAWLTDFGIACSVGTVAEPGELVDQAASSITCSRSMGPIGTLKFMAPEQFEGEPATPAFDQFAFCVALYRACYGVHPYGDDETLRMRDNVARGRMKRIPRGSEVPRRLSQAIARGLSTDPRKRFESMNDLVAHIEASILTN